MPQTGLEGLQALVRDSTASGVARRALLVRMDRLPPRLSRPHHVRLAHAALDPLSGADRARKHELPGGRIALSWRGAAPVLLRRSLQALETLLQDSPLDAPGMPELVGLYTLPRDGAELLAEAGVDAPELPDTARPPRWTPPPEPAPVPLDAGTLSHMEASLAAADMARFARRRPVCRLSAGGTHLAWEERFLSVPELTESVAPGHGPPTDPWLSRRLTRVLDRRLLALLAAPGELQGAGPFAIGLNVGSLLGPDFLRFDAALPPALRGHAVLNLQPADVLADPVAFSFARGFARARGYRLAVLGLSAAALPMLNLPALDCDYLQLRWSAALAAATLPPAGAARWVLAQADTDAAIGWGMRAGIGLFVGEAARPAPPGLARPGLARETRKR